MPALLEVSCLLPKVQQQAFVDEDSQQANQSSLAAVAEDNTAAAGRRNPVVARIHDHPIAVGVVVVVEHHTDNLRIVAAEALHSIVVAAVGTYFADSEAYRLPQRLVQSCTGLAAEVARD